MADLQIDVLGAAREGAQELGNQLVDLTLELAGQRAVREAQQKHIKELEKQSAESAELTHKLADMSRQVDALRRQVAERDAELAELRRGDDGTSPALVPA